MKKLYSIVLMAAALLVGTNVKAATPVNNWDGLKTALQAGGEVVLSADIEFTAPNQSTWDGIWMGSTIESGDANDAILNLNGHNITIYAGKAAQVLNPFILSKGSLKVTGAGKIEVVKASFTVAEGTNVFSVFGAGTASSSIDPKGTTPFSLLEIGADVTIETANGTVVLVDQLTTSHASINYLPTGQKPTYGTNGFAFGVRVDVEGTLRSIEGTKCYGVKTNGSLKEPAAADRPYAPYVHIWPSAVLESNQIKNSGSAAAYPSGYAQWLIEGTCSGASGVYVSAGKVEIHDATVSSGATTYGAAQNAGHANASGSAIVLNSRDGYAGSIELIITGDTKAESTSGYALEEVVTTTAGKTEPVESIVIEGGTFEGGAEGALVITPKTASEAQVEVAGGNVTGAANIGTDDLADFLNAQGGTHATLVEDESGHTTLVISTGDAPEAPAGGNMISNQPENASVKWTVNTKDTIKTNLKLAELEINTTGLAQELVIKENATLEVGRVVLGKDAKIIVEPGAKFIVTGVQGIVAPVATNIVLKNEEGKRSIFLFNPAVTSNKHPNATFDILSYSWRESASSAQSEVFGIPTHNAIKSVECLDAGKYGYLQVYGSNGTWENIGFTDANPFPYEQLNKPFAAYALTAYRGQSDPKLSFRFGGELVGNTDAALIANMKWSFFANSYTAEVDLAQFLAGLTTSAQSVDDAIYVSNLNGHGYWNWEAIEAEDVEDGKATKLQPMQGFLLNNKGTQVESNAINYKTMVYAPAVPGYAPAPRRMASANNNTAKMYVVVTNDAGAYDNVKLRETENTKSVEKYMNPDVNIYATAEEKSAILKAENLENTYVGFSTVNGGKFTISFENVAGREFTLVDHETGARVAVAEGNTYEFTAAANSANDYRFEIVGAAKLPTAIENTEAVKSAKGVYTITGQYVGEMNVWNTLPAGIYVVNGEKRVK